MRSDEIEATWNDADKVLTATFFRDPLELTLDVFCDAAYEKASDTLVVRVVPSMTKFRFEQWEKNAASSAYQAIRAYLEYCTRARRPSPI